MVLPTLKRLFHVSINWGRQQGQNGAPMSFAGQQHDSGTGMVIGWVMKQAEHSIIPACPLTFVLIVFVGRMQTSSVFDVPTHPVMDITESEPNLKWIVPFCPTKRRDFREPSLRLLDLGRFFVFSVGKPRVKLTVRNAPNVHPSALAPIVTALSLTELMNSPTW